MAIEPVELSDFSGGLTDNYFDGGPTRYQAADNFLVQVDGKLKMRPGSLPYDPINYLLPGTPRRVDGIFTYLNESKIAVNQGRDIYVFPDSYAGWQSLVSGWYKVLGPSGNTALPSANSFPQSMMGEYQHQLYFTNNSQMVPSRVYRDGGGTYVARTAGLPRVQVAAPYDATTLLAKCITNANTMRTAFINHITDQAGIGYHQYWATGNPSNHHSGTDKYSLSYFQAVTWGGTEPQYPGPGVSAAPAATDLTTLLALVGALNAAYQNHAVASVTNVLSTSHYHYIYNRPAPGVSYGSATDLPLPGGPVVSLSNPTTPTTLNQAASMLDDLYQKFYWHMFGVFLHGGPTNTLATINRYDYTGTISKIGATGFSDAAGIFVLQSPTITPNVQDFLDYVNGMHAIYAAHIGGTVVGQVYGSTPIPGVSTWAGGAWGSTSLGHVLNDADNVCTLPLATTLDQAMLKTYWLRNLYTYHQEGKDYATQQITFTTNSTNNITAVNITGIGAAKLPVGTAIFTNTSAFFNGATVDTATAIVASSGVGTASLGKVALGTAAGNIGYIANSQAIGSGGFLNTQTHLRRYHELWINGTPPGAGTTTGTQPSGEFLTSGLGTMSSDLLTATAYATELMYALFTHISGTGIHAYTSTTLASDMLQMFNATTTPGVSQWYMPTVSQVAYAFTRYNTWTVDVGGLQYILESNPVYSGSMQTIEPLPLGTQAPVPVVAQTLVKPTQIFVQRSMAISGIPTLANSGTTNYDTANAPVRIYRTPNGGNTFYLATTVPNGTSTYSDTQNSIYQAPGQGLLTTNQLLYTNGGVVGNDQPPQCKCLHIVNGTAYYGNIIQNGQALPYALVQSLANNPESAPATFLDFYDDEIVAINSVKSNVIVFCKNSFYRLSGGFNNLGQGQLIHERIADSVGCISPRSVVRTETGLFFAALDGFYFTDGFQLLKLSRDLNASYLAFTQSDQQKAVITGAYDKTTRRIWWSMQSTPGGTDCDFNYVLHLDYGFNPSGVFTTASNNGSLIPTAANPSNYNFWMPTSIAFQQGVMLRGDPRGLLFKSDSATFSDPKIDLGKAAYTFTAGPVAVQNWNVVPIPFNYTTCSMNFGTSITRKYATRINWVGRNSGAAQLQIYTISDDGRESGKLAPINYIPNTANGSSTALWGPATSPSVAYAYNGHADFWRRVPAKALRANFRQIKLTNAFMGVYRSQDFVSGHLITVDGTAKTVSILDPIYPIGLPALNWPTDVVDYYIAFEKDGYQAMYLISAVSAATLTVLDPGSTLVDSIGGGWVIRGYQKSQNIAITALGIRFAAFGDNVQAYKSLGDSGENTGPTDAPNPNRLADESGNEFVDVIGGHHIDA